jgi:large subunit ribosomal protein L15
MSLSTLKAAPGSRRKGKRLGRGESSGLGKTAGKGGKGQTARTGGGVRVGFEGGQMPLYRRLPKVGFTSRSRVRGQNIYSTVKLSQLEVFETGSVIDNEALLKQGIFKGTSATLRVKVLDDGSALTKKLTLKVKTSASVAAKVEAVGGSVQ